MEDKVWLTQCTVEWRTGLQQAATATARLEDSLKRADKEAAPPPSSAEGLDRLLKKYEVGDILQPLRKKGATEALTTVTGSPRSKDLGPGEVVGGDRMVMVLVSDGDRMVMLLMGDGDRMVMLLVGDAHWMVMVLVGDGDLMVMVLGGDGDRMVTV